MLYLYLDNKMESIVASIAGGIVDPENKTVS